MSILAVTVRSTEKNKARGGRSGVMETCKALILELEGSIKGLAVAKTSS